MNRQRFVKNILKMENERLAADLVQLAKKDPATAEVVILFGRTTTMKNTGQICLQAVRAINHGAEADLQHMDALAIVEGFNLQVPSVGYHRI